MTTEPTCPRDAMQLARHLDPICGTPAGYNRHKRLGTEPCGPCKDAHRCYALSTVPGSDALTGGRWVTIRGVSHYMDDLEDDDCRIHAHYLHPRYRRSA